MSCKLRHLPQVIAFEMFENMFTFYENISAPDVPPNISSTVKHRWSLFSSGENTQTKIFFSLRKDGYRCNGFWDSLGKSKFSRVIRILCIELVIKCSLCSQKCSEQQLYYFPTSSESEVIFSTLGFFTMEITERRIVYLLWTVSRLEQNLKVSARVNTSYVDEIYSH